jgi:D-sedoheptulose 7-phosphate isomerase
MSIHKPLIIDRINESISTKASLLDDSVIEHIGYISDEFIRCFNNGGKVLFCGNGGSAADAQHLAAEFTGRFYKDREPLFAEALSVNTSYLTAVSNDYSYDEVYSRLVKAFGKSGDILVSISTSGNSQNVVNAVEVANSIGMITVGFTGRNLSKLSDLCKYTLRVPSTNTPRIQESHILIGHIICEIVENSLF